MGLVANKGDSTGEAVGGTLGALMASLTMGLFGGLHLPAHANLPLGTQHLRKESLAVAAEGGASEALAAYGRAGDLGSLTADRRIPKRKLSRGNQPHKAGIGLSSEPTGALQAMRLPAEPVGWWSDLGSVSCESGICMAVGVQGHDGDEKPLALIWTKGSFVRTAAPPIAGSWFQGVSCASKTICMAVGGSGKTPFSATWIEGHWEAQPTPYPKGTSEDNLMSVDCPSPTECWAVGYTNYATPNMEPLVEHWLGGGWTIVPIKTPPRAFLNAISCSAPDDCWAVGASRADPSVGNPLMVHWNGRSWQTVTIPIAKEEVELATVFCRSLTGCWAGGAGARTGVVLRLDRSGWELGGLPTSIAKVLGPVAAACSSPNNCWVAGDMAAGHWNGTSWGLAPLRGTSLAHWPKSGVLGLQAIACPNSTECLFVGQVESKAGDPETAQAVAAIGHAATA